MKYDVVIIGSGLGGLACGSMLSREGMSVCVLEQHSVVGGCLQSFRRHGRLLDTGMHYVGSMAPGQTLNQYFKYFGVLDRLRLRALDDDAFDVIRLGGRSFAHASTYQRFVERLAEEFPYERKGLERYCQGIRRVGQMITPDVLRTGRIASGGMEEQGVAAYDYIAECIADPLLRNVVAGGTMLYGGGRERTSLYEYAMINHSNIEGAYAFDGGSQHVADALADVIRERGGEVRVGARVERICLQGGRVQGVELLSGERIESRYVISSAHPALTYDMLEDRSAVRESHVRRIRSLENSCGMFTVSLLLRRGEVEMRNRNDYIYAHEDVWRPVSAMETEAVMVSRQRGEDGGCDVVTLLAPMPASRTEQWRETSVMRRGEEYEAFKRQQAERMIAFVEPYISDEVHAAEHVVTATSLTYRDYTLSPDGSAYGIVKDCRNPMLTHIPARTKVENLLLTGQSLNVHGALGVAVTSAVTCSVILGEEYLAKKIADA